MPIPPAFPNPYFSLDAGNYDSYPGSGTAWTSTVNNITVTLSGTSFSLDGGGSITFPSGASGSFPVDANFPLGADPVSISIWIKFNQLPQSLQDPLFVIGNPSYNNCHFLFLIPDGALGYSGNIVYDMAGPLRSNYGPLYSVDNQWHHLCTTYDGSTMKTYWDGQYVANSNFSNVGALTSYSTGYLGYFNGNVSHASYKISQVDLFDVGLTSTQVLNLYNNNLPRYELTAFYDFSDPLCYSGSGNTVYDLSGNNINLPISNASYVSSGNASYFSFNGSNSYIGKSGVTGLGSTFTINIWSQTTNTSSGAAFVSGTGLPSGNAPAFYYNDPTVGKLSGSFNWGVGLLETDISNNQWNMFTYTADGTNVKLYKDGVLQGSITQGGGNWNTGGFFIGRSVDASGNVGGSPLNGKVALLEVYNAALGSTDVTNIYNAQSPRFDNLVASYDFSDPTCYSGSGNTVYDLSGSNINLSITNASYVSDGQASYFSFNGSNSKIFQNNVAGGGTTFSVNVWFKTSYISAYKDLWGFGVNSASGTNPGIAINYPNANDLIFGFSYGVGTYLASNSMSTNTWQMVTITADGTTVKFYKDGTLLGSVAQGIGTWSTGGFAIGAGCEPSGTVKTGDTFIGDVAIFEVYNTAFNSTQVTNLYNNQSSRFITPPTTNLIGSYDFSDPACYPGSGSTTVIYDLSPEGNNLTVTSTTFGYDEQNIVAVFNADTTYLYDSQFSASGTTFGGNSYSMNVWHKYPTPGDIQYIMMGGNGAFGAGPAIVIDGTDEAKIKGVYGASFTAGGWVSGTANTTNTWNMSTLVQDGSNFLLYQNGALTGSTSAIGSWDGRGFIIGRPLGSSYQPSPLGPGFRFGGNIAIAEVYNTALGSTAVNDLYLLQAPRFDNAIASYDFSDPTCYPGTGNTVYDISGSGLDLTINGATFAGSGQSKYFSFDGTNYIGTTGSIGGPDTIFTIQLWIQRTSTDFGIPFACGVDGPSGQAPLTVLSSTTGVQFQFNYGVGINNATADFITDWGLLTIVCDGTYDYIYYNDTLLSTASQGGGSWPITGGFYFGSNVDGSGNPVTVSYQGKIAIANFYNTAFDAGQVAASYNTSVNRFAPQPAYDGKVGGRQFQQGFNG